MPHSSLRYAFSSFFGSFLRDADPSHGSVAAPWAEFAPVTRTWGAR